MDTFLQSFKEKLARFSSLLLIFLSFVLLLSLAKNVLKINKANQKIEEAEEKVAKLKKENAELEDRLSQVQSEAYIEQQLRDKLGLAKEGEIVVVLPDEETLRKLAPKPVEEEETLPDPNWKRWIHLFDF